MKSHKLTGKSHLLDAIEQKHVRINDSDAHRVVKFNFETFRLENESAYNAQQISAERQEAWSFYENRLKPSLVSFKNGLGESYGSVADQCRLEKKSN